MSTAVAQLVIPRLHWEPGRGFDASRETRERGLALGVGGFVLGPAPQDDVRALTKELRARARHPLLIAADMERGAGQLFAGATGLPPLAAIAALGEPDTLRKAARLTGREARNIGVNWALAPILDLDVEPENPTVGTRSLGEDPDVVSRLGEAWIEACQQEGVLSCARHFPGLGRTLTDPHLERPVVRASRHELMARDIQPFRAAFKAGVASIMTAHVAYPALDPGNATATLSMAIIRVLLRERLGFEGLVATDALSMRALTLTATEGEAAVGALFAGCDLLFDPTDLNEIARALDDAIADGTLDAELVLRSQRRRLKWAQWASPPNEWRKASSYDLAAASELAERVITAVRGSPPPLGRSLDLAIIDDDAGQPYVGAPSREALMHALRAAGIDIRLLAPGTPPPAGEARSMLVAVFGDVLGGKGRMAHAPETIHRAEAIISAARSRGAPHLVVHFGHPRLAGPLPGDAVVAAWCGDRAMQEAVARWLGRGGPAPR